MTATRHFPNTPLSRSAAAPWRWQTPTWLLTLWLAMERYGQRRAAHELELQASHRSASDPQLARERRAAAAECRGSAVSDQTGGGS